MAAAAEAEPRDGAGAGDGDEAALRRLEELVQALYRFRDRLPPACPAPADDITAPADDIAAPGLLPPAGDLSAPADDVSAPQGDADAPQGDAAAPAGDVSAPKDDVSAPKDDVSASKDDVSAPGDDLIDPGDDLSDPAASLAAAMEKTLRLMDDVTVSRQGRGRALALRARALGVAPSGAARAEAALGRALKLEPGLGPAWTQLGEAKWRRGDLEGARACFRRALAHGEEAEARRLLSMALRAGGGGGALRESLAQAEAAVRCAPADGRSWYVLGNAYVSLFFAGGQSPEAARRALGAYAQAERVDPEAANNPDLHLNRATLLQYQEGFGAALEGLGRAAALAPGWEEPRRRHAHLLDFLSRLCALLANRGKVRGKRRRGLEGPLPPGLLGPLGGAGGLRPSPLAALRPGPNPRHALLGRALFCLTPEERVPYTVGLADGAGAVAAVTIYNAAPGWGVLVGDGLALPHPHLRHHHLQHQGKTFSFTGIRVPSPLALLVNGRRPPPSALAPPTLALRNDPAPR